MRLPTAGPGGRRFGGRCRAADGEHRLDDLSYPVQRHSTPPSASANLLFVGPRHARQQVAGEQHPGADAVIGPRRDRRRRAAKFAEPAIAPASPSTVVIRAPFRPTRSEAGAHLAPSTSTVQAPQSPASHPTLGASETEVVAQHAGQSTCRRAAHTTPAPLTAQGTRRRRPASPVACPSPRCFIGHRRASMRGTPGFARRPSGIPCSAQTSSMGASRRYPRVRPVAGRPGGGSAENCSGRQTPRSRN